MPVLIAGIVGLVSGFIGTKAMEPVTTAMYNAESAADKRREKEAQPKYAYVVAAERTLGLFGVSLDERGAQRWGSYFHYALGASWGLIYVIVRALTEWHPMALGLGMGLVMFLLVDEAMNWVFGFSPPPDRFPMWTHARGLVGHLVYGLAVALVAEGLFWLTGIAV
jgi:uncharacterized membrane protein YagU involved in acid resistance